MRGVTTNWTRRRSSQSGSRRSEWWNITQTKEVNANWSSGLTLWDWLHGTLRLDVPQREIDIGVPAYRDPDDVTLPRLIEMPFVEQPPSGRLRSGEKPERRRIVQVKRALPG